VRRTDRDHQGNENDQAHVDLAGQWCGVPGDTVAAPKK
jgi:hypothetical protein